MRKIIKYSWVALLFAFTVSFAITGVTGNTGRLIEKAEVHNSVSLAPEEDKEIAINDNPWEELEHIVNAYYQKDGVSYSGSIKLIDGNTENETVLEEQKFEYTLLGNEFHYQLGPIEMINKANFILTVDHDNKTIVFSAITNHDSKTQVFDLASFKKLLDERKATASVSQLEKIKILTVDNIQDPTIQGYRIYYFPDSYQIQKIEIGMVRLFSLENGNEVGKDTSFQKNIDSISTDDKPNAYTYYLEVNYASIKTLNLKADKFNPEERFFHIDKKHFQLTDEFKEYTLINADQHQN